MITEVVAKLIEATLPAKSWYRAAFLFTKYYARISRAPTSSWVRERYPNSFRLNHAVKLDALLGILQASATAPTFPIPIRATGNDASCFDASSPNGLLVCTIHTPLNLIGVRHLTERGLVIDGIIARCPPAEGYFTLPGTSVRIPAMLVDRNVLLKTKGILQRGGIVITSVDNLIDGRFSPNQFRLAAKLKAKLILGLVELQPDGVITLQLLETLDFAAASDALAPKIDALNNQALHIMDKW